MFSKQELLFSHGLSTAYIKMCWGFDCGHLLWPRWGRSLGPRPVAVHQGGRALGTSLLGWGKPGSGSAPLPSEPPAPLSCSRTCLACFHAGAAIARTPCSLLSHVTPTPGSCQALLAPGNTPDLSGLPWSRKLVPARAPVIQSFSDRECGWHGALVARTKRAVFLARGHSAGKSGSHFGSQRLHL